MVHIHGFAISGAYLMPTARLLAGRGSTWSRTCRATASASGVTTSWTSLLWQGPCWQSWTRWTSNRRCWSGTRWAVRSASRWRTRRPNGSTAWSGLARRRRAEPAASPRARPARAGRGSGEPEDGPVALPDYLRFGPVNGLRLFHELTRFPSLERLLDVPVPALAVLGGRDPLMPSPSRVREVGRLAPQHLAVALVDRAAHAVNFSHPVELARVIESWLDGACRRRRPTPCRGARGPPGQSQRARFRRRRLMPRGR